MCVTQLYSVISTCIVVLRVLVGLGSLWFLCIFAVSLLSFSGVGAGVINAQLDSVMSRKLRLSTVPAVVAVINGKLHWFDKHFSVQNLRDFVRGLYPPDLIQEVL